MKKIITLVLTLSLCASLVVATGCARRPTDATATKIMERYFKKYTKKYPESIIGKYPVQKVELLQIEEVHKNTVAAYAILELEGGMAVQTRFSLHRKAPFGWRTLSWENMGIANYQQQ